MGGKLSKVIFKNPTFLISISIGMLSAGAGLHQRNPRFEVMLERNPVEASKYAMKNFFHFDGSGQFEANFDFPEHDVEDFKRYHHYSKTLKELIEDNWDFNKIRAGLPSKHILVMDDKIDDILRFLTRNSQAQNIE